VNALQLKHADLGRRTARRGKTTNLTTGRLEIRESETLAAVTSAATNRRRRAGTGGTGWLRPRGRRCGRRQGGFPAAAPAPCPGETDRDPRRVHRPPLPRANRLSTISETLRPRLRLFENPGARFYVEAVTVNPTRDNTGAIVPEPEINSEEDLTRYRLHYMPIKFGSPLTSKLARRYWDLPHVAETSLLFAIQDFSAPRSMLRSRSAFETYIYGYAHDWERDGDGKLKIIPRKIESHQWGTKEIPSGFFDLPEAENVAAVVFSNSGTISKFNRMGLLAGFGSPRLRLDRVGSAVDHDPNATEPKPFRHSVNDPAYEESWAEGLDV